MEFDPEIIRERTAEHEKLVSKFVELLQQHGLTCYEGNFDLLTEQAIEALLLEMKTIDENNEREQIMKAVGQLGYYGYFDAPHFVSAGKPVRKGIVLSRAPFQADHVEFLRSMDVYVFWLDEKSEVTGEPESFKTLLQPPKVSQQLQSLQNLLSARWHVQHGGDLGQGESLNVVEEKRLAVFGRKLR